MKYTILLLTGLMLFLNAYAQEVSIADIKFKIEKISSHKNTFSTVRTDLYNIAYSSVLPDKGIYRITSISNNREAIIQLGYSMTNTPPDTIYVTDSMYEFFINSDSAMSGKILARLMFLGWSESSGENDSDFLNIQSMVVDPESSVGKIAENSPDKYYIQLGSFSYYQNSYPRITQLLPYLELRPQFYMMEKYTAKEKVYRVMAGPYSRDDAIKITKIINTMSDEPVYVQTGDALLKQDKSK